jgi:hypothetical protein
MRAADADRERVVSALKAAFVQGRLDEGELGARVGRALAARTYAELAALTADIPAGAVVPVPVRPGDTPARPGDTPARPGDTPARPGSTPARTLGRAARRSGICTLVAAALAEGAFLTGSGVWGLSWLLLFSAIMMATAALGFLGYGFVDAWAERRAHAALPPGPGQGPRGLDRGRPGETSHDQALPGHRTDPTRTDLRASQPERRRRMLPPPAGLRPVPSPA